MIHYIFMIYLFYNWEFVYFDPLHYFSHPLPLPLATTNLFSVSMSLFSAPHINKIIWCLFFSDLLHLAYCPQGFPDSSVGEESTCNAGGLSSIPRLGRSPGEGKGYPPVFWPGKFHGLYSSWGLKELDMTERRFCPSCHVVANGKIFFLLWLNNIPLYKYKPHYLYPSTF